jgi:hypothetical protein
MCYSCHDTAPAHELHGTSAACSSIEPHSYVGLQAVDTPSPVITLPDGTKLACTYEASMGSNLIMKANEQLGMDLICSTGTVLRATSQGAHQGKGNGAPCPSQLPS